MRVVRDLIGGNKPATLEVLYNGTLDADSTTLRYKGSLVKYMDMDDIDNGQFFTFAGLATVMENFAGILEEEHGTSGNYLPNDGTYACRYRKITPCFPSTVIEGEYGQADAAGTLTYDTGATASAASTTFTISITTADTLIGGWIYMLNGSCAGFLSYVDNNTTAAATTRTAFPKAVASADDFLVIRPPHTRIMDFDATFTGLKSEIDDGACSDEVMGLSTWISAPGIGKQRLDPEKHDGIIISNARFYHQFTIPSFAIASGGLTNNLWITGITSS